MKPWLGDAEVEAAEEAIRSGWVAQGPRVAAFEKALAGRVGVEHGVAVSSCTAGLHLALLALGIGPGDGVVVPSLSFIATANAHRYVGAVPVFADVDPVTQNLTVATICAALTPETRAVIVVHQIGMPADLDPIRELCDERDLHLIEDAACAIGATYKGDPIGSHSDLVVFSFHPRKILTTGEGGMIMTSRADLADRLRRLRQHGMSVSAFDRHAASEIIVEEYVESGYNYRMTDIQAAVGLVQLAKLPAMIDRRRSLAARYRESLGAVAGLGLPDDPPYGTTTFQSYSVVVDEAFPLSREDLREHLRERGVSTRGGVMAAHLEPSFEGHAHVPLTATEYLTSRSLILPLYHEMNPGEQNRVIEAIFEVARGAAP
jgi:perosamine synthetase